MSRLPVAQLNVGLDAQFITGTTYYIAPNSGDPGTTGDNEITGYTGNRQPITFLAAASGVKVSGGTYPGATFLLMPAQANGVPFFSIWTAATGGAYLGGGVTSGLGSPVLAGGTITIASGGATITAA